MSFVPEHQVTGFWNPVRITFGAGALRGLGEIFATLPGKRVVLITSAGLLGTLAVLDEIRRQLAGRELAVYEGVQPNPQLANCQEACDFARRHGAEVVLGLGGGSALDTAKAVAAVTPNGGELLPLLEKQRAQANPSLPTVMLPTTAGTGSEVTRWATFWDHAAKRKYSLEGLGMYPTCAVVDPALTLTLPVDLTAATGADALSHAMEAFWNKNANPISDAYALEAVRRIFEALPLAVKEPQNLEARTRMLLASLLAGLAFSNTKTAAAHSLSYPMTLHYGVVHGQASSITLPALLQFNGEAERARMVQLAQAVGGNSTESGARRIQVLLQRVGLKTSLTEIGIDAAGIDVCVREGYTPDRAGHNLRDLDAAGLRQVLEMVA